MTPRAHGNRGFYSGGKAQKRPLVADASKLCRTEGDSLFLLAKISWAQLPASLIKRLKLHHSFCIKIKGSSSLGHIIYKGLFKKLRISCRRHCRLHKQGIQNGAEAHLRFT